jgi:hypothetical protein
MTTVFHGDVLLPGETGSGLAASLELVDDQMTLASGSEVLATWSSHEASFEASGDGSFHLRLEGEDVFFRPDSPMAFANAIERARPAGRLDVDQARPPAGAPDVVSFSAAPETQPSNSEPVSSYPAPVPEQREPAAAQPVVETPSEDPVLDEVLSKLPSVDRKPATDEDDFLTPGMLKVISGVAAVLILAALLAMAFL